MSKRFINGTDLSSMVTASADLLKANVEVVNSLNVFPVPDGDTGTNMNLTLTSGAGELAKKTDSHLGRSAAALSKGLLMGARGNSGVILSQLFRGFAKSVADLEQATPVQFAAALQAGVDTAYKAVMKPVEGTILTVSRETAQHAVAFAKRSNDVVELLQAIVTASKGSLAKTPELLPVLKQVGVVDSGGQGLALIYEGFLQAMEGGSLATQQTYSSARDEHAQAPNYVQAGQAAGHVEDTQLSAQAQLATEDIEFPYDMEFFIDRSGQPKDNVQFDEMKFRQQLAADGDSILVIEDDDAIKVHVHSAQPGHVFNLAIQFGEIRDIHIVNMRDQHRQLLETAPVKPAYRKENGIIAVAMGEGVSNIFESIGVDVILSGGQTMNPSTEDIVKAIRQVLANRVYVLPNNSNIILSAKQAQELIEGQEVIVVPTKTIPQGMAAAIAFHGEAEKERNHQMMTEAIQQVRSGQITYAVRDSNYENFVIHESDYLGLLDNEIVTVTDQLLETSKQLLQRMVVSGDEIVTILTGAEADTELTEQLLEFAQEQFPNAEFEVHTGGQPLYYYIFSVE